MSYESSTRAIVLRSVLMAPLSVAHHVLRTSHVIFFAHHSCADCKRKCIRPPEQDGVVQLRLRGLHGRLPSVHRGQKDLKEEGEDKMPDPISPYFWSDGHDGRQKGYLMDGRPWLYPKQL
jgi:hypothetical protein